MGSHGTLVAYAVRFAMRYTFGELIGDPKSSGRNGRYSCGHVAFSTVTKVQHENSARL